MARRKMKPFEAELTIEDAASDGRAVARLDGKVVFVEGGVPGDRALVHIFRREKKHLVGKIRQMIDPSPARTEPRCSHFGTCGGCKWQMMSYAAQLESKQKQVKDAFDRIAQVSVHDFRPILGAPEPYYYRNKLEFSFSNKAWIPKEELANETYAPDGALGFHVPRVFDKVVNIDHCYLQTPVINEIRNELGALARKAGFSFYDVKENQGFLRELMFRTSAHSGEILLLLIVGEDAPEKIDRLFTPLAEKFPQVSSFLWIYNPKLNNSYQDLSYRLWRGPGFITEQLGDYRFRIDPLSFFQTNSRQAATLYQVVFDFLQAALPEGKSKHQRVYDLYAGTGSIGIYISSLAEQVLGIEYVEAANEDARKNASLNHLEHLQFFSGDMKAVLTPEFAGKHGLPDVVITDPPRSGMDPKVVKRLLELQPPHIVYVSCKPATQARDVALLAEQYEVRVAQPVDMFPQTAHVENVLWLSRKSA